MPRIPQDSLDRGISEDVRVATPQQDDALAQAIGNLGKTGEALFAKLKEKQDTSDYLDWRYEYDNTFREGRAQFLQDLEKANLEGRYDYEVATPQGGTTVRTGNIYSDRDRMQLKQSALAAKGDTLAFAEEAKRHYTAKENQLGAKLSLDITSHMNKKRRDMVDSKLSNELNNLIMDTQSGIVPSPEDLKSAMDKLSASSMESSVLGTDDIDTKRQRFLASMGQAIVSSIDNYGESPALKSALNKLSPSMDGRMKARLQVGINQAKERFDLKVTARVDKAAKTFEDITPTEYRDNRNAVVPLMNQFLSVGQPTNDRITTAVGILAKSAHLETSLLMSEVNPGQDVDSVAMADALFEQVKDSPIVKQYGEEKFRQELFRQVASIDEAEALKRYTAPDEFVTQRLPHIVDSIKSNNVRAGMESLAIAYKQHDIPVARQNYAIEEFVSMEKEFFKNHGNDGSAILRHVGSFKALSQNANRVLSQAIAKNAMPDYTYAIYDIGAETRLGAEIAEAAAKFDKNQKVAKFAVEHEGKLGLTTTTLDKFIFDEVNNKFPIPRTTSTGDTALHDGIHDAIQKVTLKRLTEQFGSEIPFNRSDTTKVLNSVLQDFQSHYTPLEGGKGSVVLKTSSLKKYGKESRIADHVTAVLDNPPAILSAIPYDINYAAMAMTLQGSAGISEDSPSVKNLSVIASMTDKKEQRRMFSKFFGDKLYFSRAEAYNNKIALTYGDSVFRIPIPLFDKEGGKNRALVFEDKDFLSFAQKANEVNVSEEIKRIEIQLNKLSKEGKPTALANALNLRLRQLKKNKKE